jgi:Uma2 family endonuclease
MTLVGFPPFSDAGLMRLGALNPGWIIERDDEGAIAVSPTSYKTGKAAVEAALQLRRWCDAGQGGGVVDSSTGFKMSTGAVRSPDASWVSKARDEAYSALNRDDFFPGPPDISIEIASPSDFWKDLTRKIEMYVREGSVYAIAIDPRSGERFERGTPPAGFVIDVEAIVKAAA